MTTTQTPKAREEHAQAPPRPETPAQEVPVQRVTPPGYPTPPEHGMMPMAKNGFGVTSLVTGIVGVVLGAAAYGILGIFLAPLAIILGGFGLGFGVANRRRLATGEATNAAATTWGISLGSVAIALGVIGLVLLLVFVLVA